MSETIFETGGEGVGELPFRPRVELLHCGSPPRPRRAGVRRRATGLQQDKSDRRGALVSPAGQPSACAGTAVRRPTKAQEARERGPTGPGAAASPTCCRPAPAVSQEKDKADKQSRRHQVHHGGHHDSSFQAEPARPPGGPGSPGPRPTAVWPHPFPTLNSAHQPGPRPGRTLPRDASIFHCKRNLGDI